MSPTSRKPFLFNFIFLFGLLVLGLNDHWWKWEYGNWWTGKISDFVGVLIFPFFLSFFFPKYWKATIFSTALFFIFWKSPYSEPCIIWYNQWSILETSRIVDYSDLMALLVLPLSFLLIKKLTLEGKFILPFKTHPIILLIPSIFIFIATSPPPSYHISYSTGDVTFHDWATKISKSPTEIIETAKSLGLVIQKDTALLKDSFFLYNRKRMLADKYVTEELLEEHPYYKIKEIILGQDTIRDFQFALIPMNDWRTKVYINGCNVSEKFTLENYRKRKFYGKKIRAYIRKKWRK